MYKRANESLFKIIKQKKKRKSRRKELNSKAKILNE